METTVSGGCAREVDMFEVTLVIVPPGGGEAEYSLRMRVPALPREGDYLSVFRDREGPVEGADIGTEDFIVRRVWWAFRYPDDGLLYHDSGDAPVGEVSGTVSIECEMAKGPYSGERHVEACGPKAERFEASAN